MIFFYYRSNINHACNHAVQCVLSMWFVWNISIHHHYQYIFQFKCPNRSMKSNFESFHKPAAHTSTHSHEKRGYGKNGRQAKRREKNFLHCLVDIFSGVVCKLMTIMTIPLGGAAWAEMAGRSHV